MAMTLSGPHQKMDPAVKKVWVERLRDPKAKQVQGTLAQDDGMCCLGHLCDVAAGPKAWWKPNVRTVSVHRAGGWEEVERIDWTYVGDGHDAVGYPPDRMLAKIGLTHEASREAARMNDHYHKSLPEIADWIEANL